jgi:hypothetical protein
MNDQSNRKSKLPERIVSWPRQAFAWKSPNQRLASIAGGLVLIITGNLVSTVYWDVFSALIPGLPWLGRMVPWAIATILGISTDLIAKKLLDRFRPKGKHWPDQKSEEPQA